MPSGACSQACRQGKQEHSLPQCNQKGARGDSILNTCNCLNCRADYINWQLRWNFSILEEGCCIQELFWSQTCLGSFSFQYTYCEDSEKFCSLNSVAKNDCERHVLCAKNYWEKDLPAPLLLVENCLLEGGQVAEVLRHFAKFQFWEWIFCSLPWCSFLLLQLL